MGRGKEMEGGMRKGRRWREGRECESRGVHLPAHPSPYPTPRTDPPVEVHQFDPSIMENCRIPLGDPGVILVNEMTVSDVQQRWVSCDSHVTNLCQQHSVLWLQLAAFKKL